MERLGSLANLRYYPGGESSMYLCRPLLIHTALAMLVVGCGGGPGDELSVSGSSRIINGTAADPAQSPQIVEVILLKNGLEAARCTGTIISSDAVLTAGHCVLTGEDEVLVRTAAGTTSAEQVLRHPEYREEPALSAIFNDVAVLRTAPLGLPGLAIIAASGPAAGETIATYGFGLDGQGHYGTLRSAQIEIAIVTDNHIFSVPFSSHGANPCLGDSGAPAVLARHTQDGAFETGIVGVVSTGTVQNCAEGDTTLFTNLQNTAVLEFVTAAAPGVVVRQ